MAIHVRIKGDCGAIEVRVDNPLIYNPNYRKHEPTQSVSDVLRSAIKTYKEMRGDE